MNGKQGRTAPLIVGCVVFFVNAACQPGDGNIRASGTIEATQVTVSARVGGDVREVKVEEGDRVKKGDVLARLGSTTLRLQRDQARDQLVQAENNARVAAEDFRRTQALFRSGSVTQKQRDDAQARADVAQAQVDAARTAVALCDEQLGYATISSPLDGVVTHKLVEEGELVFPGSALFSVSDLTQAHLTIYLTERDLARVFVGQKAEVSIDAFEKRTFAGKVVYLSPEAEFTPKNVQAKEDRVKLVFAVKIDIPNPDEVLKPGLPADAVLLEGKEPAR
jgi:HlyD family secretion protein